MPLFPSLWTTAAEPAHMPLRPRIAARPTNGLGTESCLRYYYLLGFILCKAQEIHMFGLRQRQGCVVVRHRHAAAQLWTRLGASFGACAGPAKRGLVDPPSLQVRGNKAARQRCVSVYAYVTCSLPRNFISCLVLVLVRQCSH